MCVCVCVCVRQLCTHVFQCNFYILEDQTHFKFVIMLLSCYDIEIIIRIVRKIAGTKVI